jgi:Arc/MetJ-type ribon-helix-helix transcriptional regulator
MPSKKTAGKVRIAVTISKELEAWVKARIGANKPYGSVSHAVETALVRLRDDEA